jgi:uncharacterized protein YndB with AHSA1/START domain
VKALAALALLGVSARVSAEVVSADPHDFEVRETVNLVVPPNAAWAAFVDIRSWWDSEHTYRGKSENLSLDLAPGGCFCERLPGGGGIEHMRVTYVDAGKQHLVLTGALGPLLYEAVTGVMDVQVTRIAGGARVVLDYRAAGFAAGGADKLAPAVDGVLAEQMKRYRVHATSRPPPSL